MTVSEQMSNPKVLVIAHEFPPIGGVGVQRPYKFAQYLPDFGWSPVVLTQVARYSATWDESLLQDLGDTPIVRAEDPMIRFTAWWVARRKVKPSSAPNTPAPVPATAAGNGMVARVKRFVRAIRHSLFVPDESILWLPSALRTALLTVSTHGVQAIYATSPPETSQLVAALTAHITGLPLIVDFRDPWVGNLHRKTSGWRHLIERRMERYVFARAAHVITVTDSFRQAFLTRYPQFDQKITVIPNGYDATDLRVPAKARKDTGKMVVYYGGILYEKRSPRAFLDGLALALTRGTVKRDKLCVRFAGVFDYPGKSANRDRVRELGLEDVVDVVGYVSHAAHVQLLAEADLLLLVGDQTPGAAAYVPAKLYEYLGIQKPILGLVAEGEASALIRHCQAGFVAGIDDAQEAATRLAESFAMWERGELSTWAFSPLAKRYERREQTKALAALLDNLVQE